MAERMAERRPDLRDIDRQRVVIEQVVDDQIAACRQRDDHRLEATDPLRPAVCTQKCVELEASRHGRCGPARAAPPGTDVLEAAGAPRSGRLRFVPSSPLRPDVRPMRSPNTSSWRTGDAVLPCCLRTFLMARRQGGTAGPRRACALAGAVRAASRAPREHRNCTRKRKRTPRQSRAADAVTF